MVSSNFPNYPYRLEENCWLRYQDIGGNFSNFGGELWIRKNSGTGRWTNGSSSSFTFHLNGGQVAGWNFSYDFRGTDALRLCYVEVNIGHNADGTKWFAIDGYANVEQLGYTEVHSGIQAPTIPRASTASFPNGNWRDAGQSFYVLNNRASGSFTHDTDWYFGSASGRAATGTGHDYNWTVPMSLLNQIPNATQGIGKIRTHTYSGGSMVGWTETAFGITAGAGVVPTWTSAVVEEATAGLSAIIGTGVYLQSISTLKGTITGAAGVYGSTITAQTHSVAGETVSGATATFTSPIPTSGTAVPVTQTITDTRGRQKTQTTNLNVLPYTRPIISALTVERVNASNTPDPVGTRLKLSITGVAQSIVNSTERNRMTLRVSTKPRTSSTWSTPTNIILDSGTLTYNSSYYLTGPFAVSTAYDIKVEMLDKFNTTMAQTQLGTGEIFQHWSAGLGVGKYHEYGMLDVKGKIFHGGGAEVEPVGVVLAYAGTAAPQGWLLAQGQEVSRTTYADLFAIIGITYGAGNGTSTFNLPDLRRRMPVGYQLNDPDFGGMGRKGGHRDMPRHYHGLTIDGEAAGAYAFAWGSGMGNVNILNAVAVGGAGSDNRLFTKQNQGWNRTTDEGNAASTSNLPPHIVMNYIIKAL